MKNAKELLKEIVKEVPNDGAINILLNVSKKDADVFIKEEVVIKAMEAYAEQQSDLVHDLFNNPAKKLDPLQAFYTKENPHPDGKYYLPDRTKFYEWIASKMTQFLGET